MSEEDEDIIECIVEWLYRFINTVIMVHENDVNDF